MNEIYGDAAEFGQFMVGIVSLVLMIISVVVGIMGVLGLFQRNIHTAKTNGTVTSAVCKLLQGGMLYRCQVEIDYTVSGQKFTTQLEVDQREQLTVGESVKLAYDPDRPQDVVLDGLTPRQQGLMMIGGAVLLFLIATVMVWLTRRFKFFAAAEGVAGVAGLF